MRRAGVLGEHRTTIKIIDKDMSEAQNRHGRHLEHGSGWNVTCAPSPGILCFDHEHDQVEVHSKGDVDVKFDVLVKRAEGASGEVSCKYRCEGDSAQAQLALFIYLCI